MTACLMASVSSGAIDRASASIEGMHKRPRFLCANHRKRWTSSPTMLSTFGFFGIALLVGAVPLAIKSNHRVRLYHRAKEWPKVRATVVKSSVRESTDSDGTSFRPEFSYRYSVAGTECSATEHTEGLPFPSTEEAARQMVKNLPVGSHIEVAVSLADPNCAVLDTGFPKMWQILRRVSIVAFAVGTAIATHAVLAVK